MSNDIFTSLSISGNTASFDISALLVANGGLLSTSTPTESQLMAAILYKLHGDSPAFRTDATKKIETTATTNLSNIAQVTKGATSLIRRQITLSLYEPDNTNSFDPDNY